MPADRMLLPRELVKAGYRSEEGRWAWKRDDAREVISECARHAVAVTAIEAWLVLPDDDDQGKLTYTPVIFTSDTDAKLYRWDIDPDWVPGEETWGDFITRSNRDAVQFLAEIHPEDEAVPNQACWLYYHVDLRARDEYPVA